MIDRRELVGLGAAAVTTLLVDGPSGAAVASGISPEGFTLTANGATLCRNARPRLVWRYRGEQAWCVAMPDTIAPPKPGDDGAIVVSFGEVEAHIVARQKDGAWSFAGHLAHVGKRPVELLRFDYLNGTLADPSLGLLMPQSQTVPGFAPPGAKLEPKNKALSALWTGFGVHWSMAPDPVWDEADWALSYDLAVFTSGWNAPGWTVGFSGPGVAFGEIGLRTSGDPRLFVSQILDGIVFEAGAQRPLEAVTIRHGDWQEAMVGWVNDVAAALKPRPARPAPVGFCSWYQFDQQVTPAQFSQAIDEFAALPKPAGGRIVQIDDGYEVGPGDWSPNAKFVASYAGFPAKIQATGSLAGTYLAPLLVRDDVAVVKQHPEWFQREPGGAPAITFGNWTGKTLVLDPALSGPQAFMRDLVKTVRAQNWNYLKIDFTYPISANRVGATPRRQTSFELQRAMYASFREAAGPDMLLNACVGEPARYAVGAVDACRIYGDIGTVWATVREHLVPLLVNNVVGRRWYVVDPDVFYMRREKNDLTDEENWVLTGSIALMGGLMLTSDLLRQWSNAAKARVARFWNADGPKLPSRQRIVFDRDGSPLAFIASYDAGRVRHRIGLYNWADTPRDTSLALAAARITPGAKIAPAVGGEGMAIAGTTLSASRQPAHSLRIADLVL